MKEHGIRWVVAALLVAGSVADFAPYPAGAAAPSAESQAATEAKAVLAAYNAASQKLDVSGTADLFSSDSEIVESGSVEGTFAYYLEHHIGPELKEFKSFAFTDYKVDLVVDGSYAFATESFRFRIEPKSGDAVERLAAASSVLRKTGGGWKIFRYHWSSRKLLATKP